MTRLSTILGLIALFLIGSAAHAAGTLTPVDSPHAPIQILEHEVRVVIQNGFARTEVHQTFFNPNDQELEALYAFPVPRSASLSEVTVWSGEKELHGEVLPREQAESIYEEEREQGHDAGLASKEGYQRFEFRVSPVRAQDRTRIRFVYYQPLAIDTGIGRYLYPIEDGGTDDPAALAFWMPNERVEGRLSFEVELFSVWPVADVRLAGFESEARVETLGLDHYRVTLVREGASLDRDLVFYYRLRDDLPGRLELIPYRADGDGPGTFMLVLTPGIDLAPLSEGADYTFVLDVSGSMEDKLPTLAQGVARTLGELDDRDRFRVVTFDERARLLTGDFQSATPENVQEAIGRVEALGTGGGTDLYRGLALGLDGLDDDRASSLVLVTDAVANQGVVDPQKFHALLQRVDVRVFGFLMGNNANWPLMRTICDASGGFWTEVSNRDDILGQILLAKSKVTHEALHDVRLEIDGVSVSESSRAAVGKIYRGEQLVLFGRYEEGGEARVRLSTRQTGEERVYTTRFRFPDLDLDHPELERLWALHRIEAIEARQSLGELKAREAKAMIEQLGVDHQIVTDETSMVVLTEEAYAARGLERRNRERIRREHDAQQRRRAQPVRSYRVDDAQPMFTDPAPSTGHGVGAIDPWTTLLALTLCAVGWLRRSGAKRGGR